MSRAIFNCLAGGTITLNATDTGLNKVLIIPAADGTLLYDDGSGTQVFNNIALTGAVTAGAWHGSTIAVAYGGTGVTTLTGYVKGNGTSAMTASSTIPNTDITGLGTMSTQNANSVAITGGTIAGLSSPLAVVSGGTGANTLSGLVYGNGASAFTAASAAQIVAAIGSTAVANATSAVTATNIAGGASGSLPYQTASGATSLLPKGTNNQVLTLVAGLPAWANPATSGTVTSVSGTGSVNGLTLTGTVTSSGSLTLGGTLDLSSPPAIGGTTAAAGTFTTLRVNSTVSLSGSTGTAGQVLTSNGASAPTWQSISGVGTVTSIDGSGGTTGLTLTGGPITSSGTLTLGGTLNVANGGTGLISVTASRIPYGNGTSALGTSANLTFDGTTLATTGLSDSGNLTFTGTGNRITGDFSNATVGNRVSIQSSTTNGATRLNLLPNGTGVASELLVFNSSDTANNSFGSVRINASDLAIQSGINGTGSYLPITFYTGGSERVRVDTSGNVGIGVTPSYKFDVNKGVAGDVARFTNGVDATLIVGAPTGGITYNQLNGGYQAWQVSGSEKMRIDTSGNVGIGTSSPAGKLSVKNSDTAVIGYFGGTTYAARLGANASFATIEGVDAATGVSSYQPLQVNGSILSLATGGSERMRIDANGKITDQYGNIRAVPQSGAAKTASYTLATTDVGQYIQISTSGSITIPNSTFAAGDIVSLFNNTSGNITVTCSTTNAYIAGTDTNKTSVTLATRGVATVLFITSTLCVISGNVT